MNHQPNVIAILESGSAGELLADRMATHGLSTVRFSSLEALSRCDALPSISVLVFRVGGRDRVGSLLIALAHLTHEYPALHKLAIVDDGISVMLASYLSSCSVEVVHTALDTSGVDHVARTVRRIVERRPWCIAPGQSLSWGRWSQEVQDARATQH